MRKKSVFAAALVCMAILGGCGSSVNIKEDGLRLSLGEEHTLRLSSPKKDKPEFSVMDPNIASVDENGTVKALANGITVVTARSGDSYDNVAVVVGSGVSTYVDENGNTVSALSSYEADKALISGESDITAISVSIVGGGEGDVTIGTERDYELKVQKTPADSMDRVTLRIEDGSIAKVDGKILRGLSKGKTKLVASAPNGVSTEMIVRVK